MSFEVKVADTFVRQSKQIIKNYPDLKDNIRQYILELEKSGPKGNQIPNKEVPGKKGDPSKRGFYKDRLALEGTSGKSGGIRLITYCNPSESSTIFLAMIYLKSELENPTSQMFKDFLREIKSL